MLRNWRKQIDEVGTSKRMLEKAKERSVKSLESHTVDLDDHQKVREIYQQAALNIQNFLSTHFASIVSDALMTVFPEKDVKFSVEFVERRNTTECDFHLTQNGREYSIFNSRGYGMADLISLTLRIAYILLDNVDNVAILDEPFRNLSKDKHELASVFLHRISHELDFQFIINTHIDYITEYADNVVALKFDNKNEKSIVS